MICMLCYSISRRFMLSCLTRLVTLSSQSSLLYLITRLRPTSQTLNSTLNLTTKVVLILMTWNSILIRAACQTRQRPLTLPSVLRCHHTLLIRLTTLDSRSLRLHIFPCRHLIRRLCFLPALCMAQHSHRLETVFPMWQMHPMHLMLTLVTLTSHPQCLALFLPQPEAMIFTHLSHLSVSRVVPTAVFLQLWFSPHAIPLSPLLQSLACHLQQAPRPIRCPPRLLLIPRHPRIPLLLPKFSHRSKSISVLVPRSLALRHHCYYRSLSAARSPIAIRATSKLMGSNII